MEKFNLGAFIYGLKFFIYGAIASWSFYEESKFYLVWLLLALFSLANFIIAELKSDKNEN